MGCSLQPLLPRVPERSGGLVSAGNCWLLGKLYCQVRHYIGGSVGNVGRHSEFTNVYRAAQQGNGRGGKAESHHLTQNAQKDTAGKAPLRALPGTRFRSDIYRRLISILRMSRFSLFVIGYGVPMECPYQSSAELLVAGPDEGGPYAVTDTSLCFRGLLFFSFVEGRGGGRRSS